MQEDNVKGAAEEFFKNLAPEDQKEAEIFKAPEEEKSKEELMKAQDENPETVPESLKDRRHRRMEEKLQKERESNIALNERIRTLTESQRVGRESNIDPRLLEIFGTGEVEKKLAERFTGVLRDVQRETAEGIMQMMSDQQQAAEGEVAHYEDFIHNELEGLEEAYGVDLTSNSPQARQTRREFLSLIEQLSPKDSSGELTEYADFTSAFEFYRNAKASVSQRSSARQKQIASKSAMQSGAGGVSSKESITPGFRGWEKDYGINS